MTAKGIECLIAHLKDHYSFDTALEVERILTAYSQLVQDVKSVYVELITYIGNCAIESEDLDMNYVADVVNRLEKVGREE